MIKHRKKKKKVEIQHYWAHVLIALVAAWSSEVLGHTVWHTIKGVWWV